MMNCACLLLQDSQGRYLLQMRDNTPGIVTPLMWGFFGGSVEEGETLEAAAAREMFEELGIQADASALIRCGEYEQEGTGIHKYLLRLDRPVEWGDFRVFEGAGAGFFPLEDLPLLPITSTVREFLQRGALR
jgi:8-oxo-dGTP pyrophosphatase MutT (NUDIX family)